MPGESHGQRSLEGYNTQGSKDWDTAKVFHYLICSLLKQKARGKGKIYPFKCRDPKNSKERQRAFVSDQCKEVNENSRMGKTRISSRKLEIPRDFFHANMGTIKDRNGMDLTEAEDIKKRWQEYTEELYKKDLHNPDNQDGVINHLEPDILEWEGKWALGRITRNKDSGGDEIQAELFQILKDDAVKMLHSICQQIWNLSSGHRTVKGQFSFQSQRILKLPHNCTHLTC